MTLLTNADKLNIVNQHMKSIDFQVYNLQLDLIEANAESPVNSETVSNTTSRINVLNAKRVALESEAETLEDQEYKVAEKVELIITALQQRIGELVSNYETQIAVLRAEITKLMEERDAKVEAVKDYEEHLSDLTAN